MSNDVQREIMVGTLIDSHHRLTDGIMVGESEGVAKTNEFVD